MKRSNVKLGRIARPAIMNLDDHIIESKPFMDWLDGNFQKVMYFEKIMTKKYVAYCECGGVSEFEKAKSGEIGRCPVCKAEVRLRHARYGDYSQRRIVAVLENDELGNIIQRLFVVDKTTQSPWSFGRTTVKYEKREEGRYYLECKSGLVAKYYKPVYSGEWKSGKCRSHGMCWSSWTADDSMTVTYPRNLSSVLRGTPYEYSALDIACRESFVNPFYYLEAYKYDPQLEMYYKFGLVRLAEELMGWNMYSYYECAPQIRGIKSIKELGIHSMDELPECRNLCYYNLMARKACKRWNISKELMPKAMEFMYNLVKRCGADFEYSFIKNEQLFKYWLTQEEEFKNPSFFISDYTDYIGYAIDLGLDLKDTKIIKPHDFKTMHDWVVKEGKIKETKIYDQKILAIHDAIHQLCEWEDENYSIILPSTSQEIIEEGVRQSHCVGRYCERVARGDSIILFVRKKSSLEDSWYTMEIKPDMDNLDIVQCRGYSNMDRTPEDAEEIAKVKEEYAKWFNRRPTNGYHREIIAA